MGTRQGSEVMQMTDTRGPITVGAAIGWGAPRHGRALRFLFTGVWLVYLIAPVYELFGHHRSALWIGGGVVIAVAFCGIYIYVIGTWEQGWQKTRAGLAVIFVLAVIACVVYARPGSRCGSTSPRPPASWSPAAGPRCARCSGSASATPCWAG